MKRGGRVSRARESSPEFGNESGAGSASQPDRLSSRKRKNRVSVVRGSKRERKDLETSSDLQKDLHSSVPVGYGGANAKPPLRVVEFVDVLHGGGAKSVKRPQQQNKGLAPKSDNTGSLGGLGGGSGFADAFRKVLEQPSHKSSTTTGPVLSRRKTPNMRHIEEYQREELQIRNDKVTKKARDEICREYPSVEMYAAERALKKIATRGVVVLFNAVSDAQKKYGTSTSEVDGQDKSLFVEKLKSVSDRDSGVLATDPDPITKQISHESSLDTKPKYLTDDFLQGATLSHWDQVDSGAEDSVDETARKDNASDDSSDNE